MENNNRTKLKVQNELYIARKSFNRYKDKLDAHVNYRKIISPIQKDLCDSISFEAHQRELLLEMICINLYRLCKQKQQILNNL